VQKHGEKGASGVLLATIPLDGRRKKGFLGMRDAAPRRSKIFMRETEQQKNNRMGGTRKESKRKGKI